MLAKQDIWLVIGLIVIAWVTTGCAFVGDLSPTASRLSQPYRTRITTGRQIIVEWSGYTHGHQPGQVSTFDIQTDNHSPKTWEAEYCIQLLHRSGAVMTFEQGEFHLEPGHGETRALRVRFPDSLTADAYGLALVIPGDIANTVTVQVGAQTDAVVGSLPEPACP